MSSVNIIVKPEAETPRPPPRERILAAATELFYRQGIRAVGVEAIAEAAGTNKMTLYRHFASKDDLVAECLRGFARHVEAAWSALAEAVPDPKARLRIWVREVSNRVTNPDDRGCALVNAAVEIPEKDHPARRVVEAFKSAQRDRLVGLCREAGARDPDALADELFLLIEGARVCAQSMGPKGPCCQLVRLGETVLQSHGA